MEDQLAVIDTVAAICAIGLVAVWIGYPAVIGLVALTRRVPAPTPPETWPTLSVVLATREAETAVRDRVVNLLDTDYPADRMEILVACDRSAPPPAIDSGTSVPVHVFPGDSPGGKAASLNVALRRASGQIVVFADTCQRYERSTLASLALAFGSPRTGAVTGGYRLPPGTGRAVGAYWSFERWLRRTEARVHSSVGATGAVYAIRRELWQPLPAGLILDDVFTPMSIVLAGWRVAVADHARALETRTPTPREEYGRKVRTLTGVVQLCAWMPAVLVPFRNPIWVQFLSHKVLRLLTPYFVLGLGIWTAVTVGRLLDPMLLLGLSASLFVAGVWAALSKGTIGRRLRSVVVELVMLQAAILVAGFNGLRGRWQVWDA